VEFETFKKVGELPDLEIGRYNIIDIISYHYITFTRIVDSDILSQSPVDI
jgi:hypothetical protein